MAKEPSPEPSEWQALFQDLRQSVKRSFGRLQEAIKRQKVGDLLNRLRRKKARKAPILLSHWHQLFGDWQESVQTVYTSLEQEIERRKIPDVKISRIVYREGGILSAKREYLRIRRKGHIFDICAAPFGTGFFVSWWLGETPGLFCRLILIIPLLGPLLVRTFRPETYYRLDTAFMFQGSVHSATLRIIEQLTEGKGVRALSELEKKPIMSDLFKRKLS